MRELANMALSESAKNVWLAGTLVKFLIQHNIGTVHLGDGPEGARLKTIDTGGYGLAEKLSCLSSCHGFGIESEHPPVLD